MAAPVVIKPIPAQIINELAAYGPFNLKDYINTPDGSPIRFSAALKSGSGLPKGMICTQDGILTGIPGKGTEGNHEFVITAENAEGKVATTLVFAIKPSLGTEGVSYIDKIKAQVWDALENNLPVPDLSEMLEREITPLEIYYLLERWGILTIWDVFNLEPPGAKVSIELEGASPHYYVYDRGSCLIATPKDLYSHERTINDGMQTAKALAREAYQRNWTIELVGIDRLRRAAWIELQHLGDQHGKRLEILNYKPSTDDLKLYATQAIEISMQKPESPGNL